MIHFIYKFTKERILNVMIDTINLSHKYLNENQMIMKLIVKRENKQNQHFLKFPYRSVKEWWRGHILWNRMNLDLSLYQLYDLEQVPLCVWTQSPLCRRGKIKPLFRVFTEVSGKSNNNSILIAHWSCARQSVDMPWLISHNHTVRASQGLEAWVPALIT